MRIGRNDIVILKGYSNGQSYFSKMSMNTNLSLILFKDVQKCAKVSKNQTFSMVFDKTRSTSDVGKFYQWHSLEKKTLTSLASANFRDRRENLKNIAESLSFEANLRIADRQF